MTKENTTLAWITPSMVEIGLSETVLNYLLGKKQKVTAEDLTIKEFFILWLIKGEAFERSKLFKEWKNLFFYFEGNIDPRIIDHTKERWEFYSLISSYIPLMQKVRIADSFSDGLILFENASSEDERIAVLSLLKKCSMQKKLDRNELQSYYSITAKYPKDRIVAEALLSNFIMDEPDDALKMTKYLSFSREQILGLINNFGDGMDYHQIEYFINLYLSSLDENLLVFLKNFIEDRERFHPMWFFEGIQKKIRSEKGKEKVKKNLLSLTYALIKKIGIDTLLMKSSSDLREMLPKYDKRNLELSEIMQSVINFYKNYKHGLSQEYFKNWYRYAKTLPWIEPYTKSLIEYPHQIADHTKELFELTKNKKVIVVAITEAIPRMANHPEQEFGNFLTWIKSVDSLLYTKAIQAAAENKLLDAWLESSKKYNHHYHAFLGLAKHFA